MKKIAAIFLFCLSSAVLFSSELRFQLKNSAYIYNGENGSYWEQTRTTITYLEDVLEPSLILDMGNAVFEAGAGLLFPFNQEQKLMSWYPVLRTTLYFGDWKLVLGSLEGDHDLPTPILNPLISLTPQIRIISTNRVPLPYENFPLGLFSHGRYEYGLSLQWESLWGGELYVNWQLPDSTNHRERFDMGLIQKGIRGRFPWYTALHYWHNGGHENPHPISITENYNIALGIQNRSFSVFYLASYWLPDREANPQLNQFGQAIYGRFTHPIGKGRWFLEEEVFLSSELLFDNQRYIAIEADPFYQMPLYLGVNIHFPWKINSEFTLDLAFKNGVFWPGHNIPWNGLMIRYDQMIRVDLKTSFGIIKKNQKSSDQDYSAFNTKEIK